MAELALHTQFALTSLIESYKRLERKDKLSLLAKQKLLLRAERMIVTGSQFAESISAAVHAMGDAEFEESVLVLEHSSLTDSALDGAFYDSVREGMLIRAQFALDAKQGGTFDA